jgi:hypothetical protein
MSYNAPTGGPVIVPHPRISWAGLGLLPRLVRSARKVVIANWQRCLWIRRQFCFSPQLFALLGSDIEYTAHNYAGLRI